MAELSSIDKRRLEKLLGMEGGHVLTLSKRELKDFILDSVERDLESGQYDDDSSNSKAKRLRRFWELESNSIVGQLIYDLIEFIKDETPDEETRTLIGKCSQISERLLKSDTGDKVISSSISSVSSKTKDFFVSYNSADAAWAEWIAWTLEARGHSVIIQEWDFRPGGNFILDMQQATTHSRQTIMVLSDSYIEALYVHPEWAAAFKQDPISSDRKLLPIRIAPCTLPGMLASLTYVDLVGKTEAESQELLLKSLQARAKPTAQPTFPETVDVVEQPEPDDATFHSAPEFKATNIEGIISNDSSSQQLSGIERLRLIQTLNALPSTQFDEIVFALNPPVGNMPGNSAPQGSRSKELLAWLESPVGSGLTSLKMLVESILSTRSQSKTQTVEKRNVDELLQTITELTTG